MLDAIILPALAAYAGAPAMLLLWFALYFVLACFVPYIVRGWWRR